MVYFLLAFVNGKLSDEERVKKAYLRLGVFWCLNPRTHNEGGLPTSPLPPPPPKVFFKFLLEDQTSAPAVFISCLFIPRTHFEAGLVMVDYYGYEI